MRNRGLLILAILMPIFLFTVFTCEMPTESGQTGKLTLLLTDAPFPAESVAAANVTIDSIDIRAAGGSGSTAFETVYRNESGDTEYNLLDLRNGVTATLADVEIPEGEYDLVRLYIRDASIELKDGPIYNLKVPSGLHTGLKVFIRPDLQIRAGSTAELVLDIDVSKSFVARGSLDYPNDFAGFIFQPVVRAVNQTAAGKITGTVTDSQDAPLPDASVWVEQADTVVTSTITNDNGKYALIALPEGTYTLRSVAAGIDTTTVQTDVAVTAGEATVLDFQLPLENGQQ